MRPTADRFAARLALLPHAALLEFAAQMASDSAASRRTADAILAQQQPLPQWACDSVLLSPDLLLHIFAHLDSFVDDAAAAAVCRPWRAAWDATDAERRWLRRAKRQPAETDVKVDENAGMARLPDGRIFISRTAANHQCILDSDFKMMAIPTAVKTFGYTSSISSELGLFVGSGLGLRRYEQNADDFVVAAEYKDDEEDPYSGFDVLALAPNNALFAVGYDFDVETNDEIICLDARTLKERFKFGRGDFDYSIFGLAVIGDELFVTDTADHKIVVYSLAGQRVREIRGPWRRPTHCVSAGGRLYLVEEDSWEDFLEEEEEGEVYAEYTEEGGRRIFVLTPGGEVLQKLVLVEKGMRIMRIFLCGSEILCTYIKTGLLVAAADEPFRVVALTGL